MNAVVYLRSAEIADELYVTGTHAPAMKEVTARPGVIGRIPQALNGRFTASIPFTCHGDWVPDPTSAA